MKLKFLFFALAMFCVMQSAYAGTLGHYYPGVLGMRDIIMPPKGFYTIYYNPIYGSNSLQDAHGKELSHFSKSETSTRFINVQGQEIPVKLSANLSADINTSMMFTTQQLLLMWVPGWKFLGADYAMILAPSLGYVSIKAKIRAREAGTITVEDTTHTVTGHQEIKLKSDDYGFGDMLVQPLMLDWRGKHYDVGVNYGFFAPTGSYQEKRAANVGMAFWTQQFQVFGAYYFDKNHKTALITTTTYNLNSKRYSQDLTPGQSMTLEYALSHYMNSRVEVGVCGYDQWQISSDTGTAARNKDAFYQIHAIGGQFTGWIIKEKLSLTTKCYYEYYGVGRFKGILGTANLIYVF
ncbi:MAG: transporter [Candidatus Omnitrophota bacterium]